MGYCSFWSWEYINPQNLKKLVLKFVPGDLDWQHHMVPRMAAQWYLKWLYHHARSHVALPFEVPGDKIQDPKFRGFVYYYNPKY